MKWVEGYYSARESTPPMENMSNIILKSGLAAGAAVGLVFFSFHFLELKTENEVDETQPAAS